MPFRWDDPKDPSATEDATSAIKRASEYLSDTLGKMKDDFPFLAYDDAYPKYGGRMRLNYLNGIGGWQDVLTVLIAHGYEVTAKKESATETEKELDKVDEWIVIEYGEVE